jgi:glycerol-3-phosphate acyltransferase PlsY
MIWTGAYLVGGFLLGSIPFGYVLVRVLKGTDVRTIGSGNIGATNVGRALGKVGGLATLLLDGGKGAFAVMLARQLTDSPEAAAVAGLGAILGHCYTPWLGFRGGKGVATMVGTFLLLAPQAATMAVITFAAVVAVTRTVSLASMLAAGTLLVATLAGGANRATVIAAAVSLVVVMVRHRDNIGRLLRGQEPRIGGSK